MLKTCEINLASTSYLVGFSGMSIYLFYGLPNSVEGERERDSQELTDASQSTSQARAPCKQSTEHLSSGNPE